MKVRELISHKIFICLIAVILSFTSCQLFETDVSDFMEQYTETAAVEQHIFTIQPYYDKDNNPCINSSKDFEVTLYMRNPKNFSMQPSVDFPRLSEIDTSNVSIEQLEFDTLKMLLPQSFLLAADEGKNITTDILLYEPMSGRTFVGYDITLFCNSIPPMVQNSTIINNHGSTFVIAFDMPMEDELALRNKDISSIVINGTEYPMSVANDGSFAFESSQFTRNFEPGFIFINDKDFTHTARSVYFNTEEPFVQGDKDYTIGLKDSAGLIQTILTGTSIARLNRPSITDVDDTSYATGSDEMVSGSRTDPFKLTLAPPTRDHKGEEVSEAILHYTVYKGTSTVSAIVQEGNTTGSVELSLIEGTYHIEAYAKKTNYEQSQVLSVNFRVVDNAIFVSSSNGDDSYDGTRELPFRTLNRAIADIDVRNMPNAHLTIYVDGTLSGTSTINASQTRSITIMPRTGSSAAIDAQGAGTTITVNTSVPVTFKNITITGGNGTNGGGIYIASGSTVTLKDNATVSGNSATNGGGIYNDGTLNLDNKSVVINNSAATAGGGIYSAGTTKAEGFVKVISNTVGSNANNLYLPSSKVLTVTGSLTSESNNSQIGIFTQTKPNALTAVPITSGYGYNGGANSGKHPGNFFIGDEYAINKDEASGETTVFINSGSFNDYLSNLNVNFAISPNEFQIGTTTTITVTPTITYGSGTSASTIPYASIASRVSWIVKLKNGSFDVEGVSSTTNTITIPATVANPDSYKLYVKMVIDGIYPYDDEVDISGIL